MAKTKGLPEKTCVEIKKIVDEYVEKEIAKRKPPEAEKAMKIYRMIEAHFDEGHSVFTIEKGLWDSLIKG